MADGQSGQLPTQLQVAINAMWSIAAQYCANLETILMTIDKTKLGSQEFKKKKDCAQNEL